MGGMWDQIFGDGADLNRADRRALDREHKRYMRRNQRAQQRKIRELEAQESKPPKGKKHG